MMTAASVTRWRLRIEFDGATFGGWQLQAEAIEAKSPSVQGCLTRALKLVLRLPAEVHVQGSGRTDVGVHARDYWAHFDVAAKVIEAAGGEERVRHALNGVLPEGLAVLRLERAPDGFHALESIVSKTYVYRVLLRRAKPALGREHLLWLPLEPARFDVSAVRVALASLLGEHDFHAFAAANHSAATTRRTLTRAELVLESEESDAARGTIWRFEFEGPGFLKQMVRNLVGTLLQVGQGRRDAGDVARLLATAAERQEAGPCAAAHALCLERIVHAEGA
jgi:tRNA pseudouridine38-40 synthase